MMKQKITFKLCLAMLGLLLSFSAGAANKEGEVTIDPLKYTLYDDSTASVVAADKSTISGKIVIPESVNNNDKSYRVTSIGSNAFNKCSGLTAITIPNSVTTIGNYAFYSCGGLTAITIPNSVTTIGENAFYKCTGLKEFIVATDNPNYSSSNGILYNKQQTEIIQAPHAIRSVNIPNSVTTIGNRAFNGCSGLTAITIPNSVTTIGNEAFTDCTGLTSITIPNNVTTIGSRAFRDCSGLTAITIGNSVKTIGDEAFMNCSGSTSITIGNSVKSIDNWTFYNCTGLKEFIVAIDNPNYSSLDGILYNKQQTEIRLAPHAIRSVTIPNSVTTIGDWAFQECIELTAITIPNSMTTIGENAFYKCSKLATITIPNSVTTIGGGAFDNCSGLTAITIGNSVKTIGNYAFRDCSGLTAITIPNSVITIGNHAFRDCSGLTAITIGNSVKSIGNSAFYKCSKLTTITIGNSVKSIGQSVFQDCSRLQEIKVYVEEPISINEGVFKNVNYSTCKLYVPQGSIDKYQAANIWKLFSNILALADGSAIEGVDEDKLNVYSVDGKVVIKNLREGEAISICNTTGQNVYQGNETEVPLSKGIYFVKVGTIVSKVMVQ